MQQLPVAVDEAFEWNPVENSERTFADASPQAVPFSRSTVYDQRHSVRGNDTPFSAATNEG